MRVLTDSPFDDTQRWIEFSIPRADTNIVVFTAAGHEASRGGPMNITFVADGVVATAAELKGRGVELVQEPHKADWGTAAVFKDPDGNVFPCRRRRAWRGHGEATSDRHR